MAHTRGSPRGPAGDNEPPYQRRETEGACFWWWRGRGMANGWAEPLKEPCRPSGTHLLWACHTSHSGPHSLTERKVKKERTPGSQGTVLGVFWTWEGIVKPRGILQKETRHGDPGENERT